MENPENKEKRLKKLLLEKWDKDESDLDDLLNLDPLIKLMYNGLLYQYEDVYHLFDQLKKKYLNETARLLLPDVFMRAFPAHTVLLTSTIENSYNLKPFSSFTVKRRTDDQEKSVSFINLREIQLLSLGIDWVSGPGMMLNPGKKIRQSINLNFPNSDKSLCFGMKSGRNIFTITKKISFFFNYELSNLKHRFFFHSLLNGKWMINDMECEVLKGLPPAKDKMETPAKLNYITYYSEFLNKRYENNFITISFSEQFAKDKPELLLESIDDQINQINLPDADFVIKVIADSYIDMSVFDEGFSVYTNAVPVMNLKAKKAALNKSGQAGGFIKTQSIELEEDEYYVYFIEKPYPGNDPKKAGNTIIEVPERVSAFTEYDLKNALDQLIRAYDTEFGLFDFKDLDIDELGVARLFSRILHDKKLQSGKSRQGLMNFRSVADDDDRIDFDVYTSIGIEANGIPAKSKFECLDKGIKEKKAESLMITTGGKDPLSDAEYLSHLRFLLLSRNKIVTREDIINLALRYFGEENIKKVEFDLKWAYKSLVFGLGKVMIIKIILKDSEKREGKMLQLLKEEMLSHLLNNANDLSGLSFDIQLVYSSNK